MNLKSTIDEELEALYLDTLPINQDRSILNELKKLKDILPKTN